MSNQQYRESSPFRFTTEKKMDWFLAAAGEQRPETELDRYAAQFQELPILNGGLGSIHELLHTGGELFKYSRNKARIIIVAGLPGSGKTDLTHKYVTDVVRGQIEEYKKWYEDIYGEPVKIRYRFANWDFHEEEVKRIQQETVQLHRESSSHTPGESDLIWVFDDKGKVLRPYTQDAYKLIGSIARLPQAPTVIDFNDFNRVAEEFKSCVPIPGEQYQDEFLRFTGQHIVNEIKDEYAHVEQQNAQGIHTQLVLQLDTLALTAAHIALNMQTSDEDRIDEIVDMTGTWIPREHISVREYHDEAITDVINHQGDLKHLPETDINIVFPFPSPRLLLLIQFREYLLNLKQEHADGKLSENEILDQANHAARIFKLKEFPSYKSLQQVQEGGSVKQVLGAWNKSHTIAEAVRSSNIAEWYPHQFGPIFRFHRDVIKRHTLEELSSTHKTYRQIIKDAADVATILDEDPYTILEFFSDHLTLGAMTDQYLGSNVDIDPRQLSYPHNINYRQGAIIYALLLNEPYLEILDENVTTLEERTSLKKLLEEQKRGKAERDL